MLTFEKAICFVFGDTEGALSLLSFEPTISIANGLEVTEASLLKRAEDIYQLLDGKCRAMLL